MQGWEDELWQGGGQVHSLVHAPISLQKEMVKKKQKTKHGVAGPRQGGFAIQRADVAQPALVGDARWRPR